MQMFPQEVVGLFSPSVGLEEAAREREEEEKTTIKINAIMHISAAIFLLDPWVNGSCSSCKWQAQTVLTVIIQLTPNCGPV